MATPEIAVGFDEIKALASRSRYRILQALSDRRRTVSELADRLDVTKGTVHRHLQTLVEAGFVHRHEDDRMWVYYELTPTGETLASAKRPRVVLRLSGAVVAAVAAVAAIARAATLTSPGGGTEGQPAPGPQPPPPDPGLLQMPSTWIVVAAVLVVVAVVGYVAARRAVGP